MYENIYIYYHTVLYFRCPAHPALKVHIMLTQVCVVDKSFVLYVHLVFIIITT